MIDAIFFVIFLSTAILLWLPIFAIFFLPFYFLRRLRRFVRFLGSWLGDLLEKKLIELAHYKELVNRVAFLEKLGKDQLTDLIHQAYKRTVWWTRFEILQEVEKKARVLDIGCGNGYLAKLIAQTRQAQVTCVDIVDYNETDLETILFDGVKLPFPDNSFDVVILSYVLHHSGMPQLLLQEAGRVCRGRIIIYEDEAPLVRSLMAKIHQFAYNWMYDLDSPVNYLSLAGWRYLFEREGFFIDQEKSEWQMGALVRPVKKAVFVLKPRK